MRKTGVKLGSGNIFADLGLPNPEQELLKARRTLQIYKIVKARGLTQTQVGEILGIKQPHVSTLMRNRAGNFSVGRLMEFLTALGLGSRSPGWAPAKPRSGSAARTGGPGFRRAQSGLLCYKQQCNVTA
jgi:predicted XRE-type DNA-binding protein